MTATPAGGETLGLTLRGTAAAEVVRGQAAVSEFMASRGAAPRVIARAELIVEEVALNSMRHGHADQATAEVRILLRRDPAGWIFEFEDRGAPFDPTEGDLPPDQPSPAGTRSGGFGLLLIRRTAAALAYERTADGRNRLRLVLADQDSGPAER